MAARWLELLIFISLCALVRSGLSPSRRGEALTITPKACTVNKVAGVCMFVWECIHHEGKHLGMCMDAFMFGSCCHLPDNHTVPTVASEPQAAGSEAVSSYISQQSSNRPNSVHSRPSTKRPYYNKYSTTTTTTTTTTPAPLVTRNPISSSENSVDYTPPEDKVYPPHLTTKYPAYSSSTTLKDKVNAYSSSKYPSMSMDTKFTSTTEPNFITRPKPTYSWSASIRPRPPDQVPGSFIGQRPQRPTLVKPSGVYLTKKPSKPLTTQSTFESTTALTTKRTTTTTSTTTTTTTTTSTTTTPKTPALFDFLNRPTKPPLHSSSLKPSSTPSQSTASTATVTKVTSHSVPHSAVNLTRPITSRKECGVPPLFPRPEMRIVGGKSAPFGGWPWQVSVRRTSFFGFSSTHRCGGAVLNENWIATAGHCVDDLLTSQIRVRVGEYDFSSSGEPLAHEERGVVKKVVHPKYNFFTYEYDLALVQLDRPLQFAPHVAPICLPGTDDLLVGETATVTGWGRLSEGGTLPSVLQEVSVPIVSNEKCKSMFLRAGRHEHIPEIFLCAGYEDGGRDSCQGDSGGPLQVRGKDGRYFLAGIISWGIGCAENNLPGVCTRISKFVDWIMENVSHT